MSHSLHIQPNIPNRTNEGKNRNPAITGKSGFEYFAFFLIRLPLLSIPSWGIAIAPFLGNQRGLRLESIVHMLPHAGAHGRDEHHEQHVAPIHDDLSGIRQLSNVNPI